MNSTPEPARPAQRTDGVRGRLPNFLIIGAAKSGTTSVARYLERHPDVFMPIREAPAYFACAGTPPRYAGPNADVIAARAVWRLSEYLRLFAAWRHEKAAGEKSTQYLSSPVAPRAISEAIPDARLIVILRNPADRAFSQFTHNLRSLREPLKDFRAALEAEPERKKANWSYNYWYRERGRYAPQLERYYALFPRTQILVLLFDDLVADAAGVMRAICRHLDISEAPSLPISERHNVSVGVPRNDLVHRFLTRDGMTKSVFRSVVPAAVQRRIWNTMFHRNLAPLPAFEPGLRRQLIEEFSDDVEQLERLIGRDLSAWRAGERP